MANTYQIFFGRNIPKTDRIVGLYDWRKFLRIVDTIVDGYTWVQANGVWKGEPEDGFVMTVYCEPEAAYDIARTYRNAFDQESVGIVTLPKMEFI